MFRAYCLLLINIFSFGLINGCGGAGSDAFVVVKITPGDEQQHIDIKEPNISAVFSRDIDDATLTSSTFSVMRMQFHEKIKGNLKYDSTTRTATFIPEKSLEFNEQYSVKVSHNVTDKAGNHLASSKEWDFETTGNAPTIISFQPDDNDTEVSTRSVVRISLTGEVNRATVTRDTFYLHKESGDNIPGTYEMSSTDVVFKPALEFELNTRYHATATVAIKDLHGNSVFATNKSWSFTTAANRSFTTMVGGSEDDQVNAIAIDASGNIYIAGASASTIDGQAPIKPVRSAHSEFHGAATDILFAKYNTNGVREWLKLTGTDQPDAALKILLDTDGIAPPAAIYIAGTTSGILDNSIDPSSKKDEFETDIFLMKVDLTGNVLWKKQIRIDGHDMLGGIVRDKTGNIYVVGSVDLMKPPTETTTQPISTAPPSFFPMPFMPRHQIVIAKYDTNSNLIKQQVNDNPYDDTVRDARIDATGSLIVAGMRVETTGKPETGLSTSADAFYALYDPNTLTEKKAVLLKTAGKEMANSVAVDRDGNIYLGGSTTGSFDNTVSPFPNDDAFLAKFNSAGTQQWTQKWGTSDLDSAQFIELDAQGNPLVVSTSALMDPIFGIPPPPPMPIRTKAREFFGPKVNIFIYKFNAADGSTLWDPARRISAESHANPTGLVVDGLGNLFVTGSTHGSVDGSSNNGNEDGFFTKFDANGIRQ